MALFTNGRCSSTPEKRHSPSDSIRRNSPKVFYNENGPRSNKLRGPFYFRNRNSGLRIGKAIECLITRVEDASEAIHGEHGSLCIRHVRQLTSNA